MTDLTERQVTDVIFGWIKEGKLSRDSGKPSPYNGQSLAYCLHSHGWVYRDLMLALAVRDPTYKRFQIAADNMTEEDVARFISQNSKEPAKMTANVARVCDHELKVHPEFWRALVSGSKCFDVRRNDRNFKAGQFCELRQYDPSGVGYMSTTAVVKQISYVLTADDFPVGLQPGYVVLGFAS